MRPQMPPVSTPDNKFHDGNPLTGELGTIVTADHLNNEQEAIRDTQEELIAVLTASGKAPDSTAGQLLAALKLLFAEKSGTIGALSALTGAKDKLPYFTGANAATLTDLTSVGRDILASATKAAVLEYLGLGNFGTAAEKNVGTGAGEIPDMSAFPCLLEENGWEILPNGKIKQWGLVQMDSSEGGNKVVTLPVPFPGKPLNAQATINAPTNYPGNMAVYVVGMTNTTLTLLQDNATATYVAKVYWEVTGK